MYKITPISQIETTNANNVYSESAPQEKGSTVKINNEVYEGDGVPIKYLPAKVKGYVLIILECCNKTIASLFDTNLPLPLF